MIAQIVGHDLPIYGLQNLSEVISEHGAIRNP